MQEEMQVEGTFCLCPARADAMYHKKDKGRRRLEKRGFLESVVDVPSDNPIARVRTPQQTGKCPCASPLRIKRLYMSTEGFHQSSLLPLVGP